MVAHWNGLDRMHANSIDFSNKRDAELLLNRFALINIDEFDSVSSSHQSFLKHMLNDPTGSRHFICIELTDNINHTIGLNHKQLYAQVAAEILRRIEQRSDAILLS